LLKLQSPMILGAAPIGLVVGALAWLLFGGEKPLIGPVQAIEADLNALNIRARGSEAIGPDPTAQALAAPLFATSTLAPIGPDVAVKVLGIARTPSGSSALVSISNGPSQWLTVGANKDGITLQEVTGSGVVIDTPGGAREVALGQMSAPSPMAPGQAAAAPPQGLRMPPAPTSAPGVHQ
jgi:hypothetical protein